MLTVSIDTISIPHIDEEDRFAVERLGPALFKVTHVTIRLGYADKVDVPESLRLCRKHGLLARNLDLEHASYFVSRITITPTNGPPWQTSRKKLFVAMARNAASPIDHFGLPGDRTVMMGSRSETSPRRRSSGPALVS
jgi:KUP system potassium uptake protein